MPMQNTESIYQDSYLTIPRSIFLDQELSLEAMVLYSFLMDRTKLSEKNKLIDEQGIFVYCSIEEAAEVLRVGRSKCIQIFEELVQAKRILRQRQGQNKANKYYVLVPSEVCVSDVRDSDHRKSEIQTPEVCKSDPSNNKSNNNNFSNNESSISIPSPSLSPTEDPFLVTRLKCRMNYFQRSSEGESKEKLDAELQALIEQSLDGS